MSETILIVENHEAMRKSLCDWLELAFPQYRVIKAASGEEAVAMVLSSAPRVVVMDIGLPQMSGIAATRRIKTAMPAVQVVILTIYEDEIHRASAIAAGASGYVPKRTMDTELLPALAEILSAQ